MKKIITGASGFIGAVLLESLKDSDIRVIGRNKPKGLSPDSFLKVDLTALPVLTSFLQDSDVVIHCAARAHVMNESETNSLAIYRRENVEVTVNLARQAAQSGVRRFIFLSSIKVNGEGTEPNHPFRTAVLNLPSDPYARSKYEAEVELRRISDETGMEVVIIRPPLVYGLNVKANFLSMLKFAASGVPLPFGALTKNRRSLVYVENLVDLIVNCIDHPNATNKTFLVSDHEDLSTAEIFYRLSKACGRSGKMINLPTLFFKWAANITGKPKTYQRLCGSLQVDIGDTVEILGWSPPFTVNEGFAKTAKHYLDKNERK